MAENKTGRLTSLTLLPERARIEPIGGPGKEAWVDGQNYPFEPGKSLSRHHTPGAWRLEISPPTPQLRDTFLHVLFVDDASAPAVDPASVLRLQTSDSVGVRVGGWSVQFPHHPTGKATISRVR